MRRVLAVTLALFALIYGIALVRYAPPRPASSDAPLDRFSATRARDAQARLVGDGGTRFIGTPGNARGRELIAAELEKLGWTVETQKAMSCTHHGMCGPVANVLARLPGRDVRLPGVLVTAHHDSVPVSPGASDDGLGTVAVLETARALAQGPKPRRTIVLALTDGEEAGLLGASAFAEHPLAATVTTTVNVDSRGSRGPSQMFETSAGNGGLITLVAENVERPVTTSLFFEVYKRMPNDTDFSITKTFAAGVNFANIAGIEDYHTPLDALAASDLGTLQQHGDNVLVIARAFAETDADRAGAVPRRDAVWFDVLALGIVRWPESWSMLLALVALALVVGQGIRARAFDRGLVVFYPSLVLGLIASLFAGWLLKTSGALPAPFVATPAPALAAINVAAGACVVGTALVLAGRSSPRALWTGTWVGWGTLGVATAAFAPGASYLFIVPTLVAGLTSALPLAIASVAPAAVAATLVLALATGVYDALGFAAAPIVALPTLLLATTLAPMLHGGSVHRRAPLVLGGLAVACALIAALVPKFTPAFPQRANVVFRQDETSARVFVDTTWGPSTWGKAPPAMLAAIGGPLQSEPALPWTLASLSAEVPRAELSAPVAEVLSVADDGTGRRVRARLRSARGAPTIALVFPVGRQVTVSVAGRKAIPRAVQGGTLVGLLAVPPEGIVVELETRTSGAIPVTLLDRTFGVLPGTKAEAAVRARPADATQSQDGDVTVVSTTASL